MARNCLILGTLRAGKSTLASMLAPHGYYFGEHLRGATDANPLGSYESSELTRLNEELLARGSIHGRIRKSGRSWLRKLSRRIGITYAPFADAVTPIRSPCVGLTSYIRERMAQIVAHEPFALNEPTLGYTVEAWSDVVPADCVYICVYRAPIATAQAIVSQWDARPNLPTGAVTLRRAVRTWVAMYRHILAVSSRTPGDWVFIKSDLFCCEEAIERLGEVIGAKLNADAVSFQSTDANGNSAYDLPHEDINAAISLYNALEKREQAWLNSYMKSKHLA